VVDRRPHGPAMQVHDHGFHLDCGYQDDPVQNLLPATEAVFLWMPPALALSDPFLHSVITKGLCVTNCEGGPATTIENNCLAQISASKTSQ